MNADAKKATLRMIVGEVMEHISTICSPGRADAAILEMKDLGDNVFYGG